MSNKNPKHKKKISEEDLKKHLDERNKNVVEKDNIPTFKPKKKVEDQVVKKDPGTNIHRNKKGEVVVEDEKGIYRPIVRKQATLSQGNKKTSEEYNKEQKIIEEVQSNDLGLRAPLHYLANPDHMLGDLGNLTGFKPLQNFNNSDEDAKRYNYQSLDPSKSKSERFNNNLNEGLNLVPKASINLGLASLASKTPLGALKEAYNPIAGTGNLAKGVYNKGALSLENIGNKIDDKLTNLFYGKKGVSKSMNVINRVEIKNIDKLKKRYKNEFENKYGKNYSDKDLELYVKLKKVEKGKLNDIDYNINEMEDFIDRNKISREYTSKDKLLSDIYTKGYDSSLNRRVPKGITYNKDLYEDVIPQFEDLILKNKLKKEEVLYRGNDDYLIKDVWRNGERLENVKFSDLQKGDEYKPNSFYSTSIDKNVATRFGNIASKIEAPKGQSVFVPNATKSGNFPNELEVVLPEKLRYRVDEIYEPKKLYNSIEDVADGQELGDYIKKGELLYYKYNDKPVPDNLIKVVLNRLNFDIAKNNKIKYKQSIVNPYILAPIGLGASYLGTQETNKQTSQFRMGGNLKQQTNNNMLNEINEGGLHEENKLGGVPMGVGQNGQMNTVEQGETKKDSFIYSNRITLTPQVIAQFNLPKSLAGKTAADATKLINNKFEGRNSKIDNNTKKAFLDRIAEAQETIKAEEQAKIQEAMQINSTEVPDMMEGQIPQGMEEFLPQKQMFLGGFTDVLNVAGATGILGQSTGISQLVTGVDLANTAFGKTGVDTSGATDVNPGNISVGGSALSGAAKGALAGSMFGPLGTGVGAAIGGVAGLVGGGRAKKDALKAHQNFEIGQSNQKISNFAYGGKMYNDGGYLDKFKSSTMYDDPNYVSTGPDGLFENSIPMVNSKVPKKGQFYKQSFNQMGRPQISNDLGYTSKLNYNDPELAPENVKPNSKTKLGETLNKAGQYVKDNYGNALRYAPVAMNAYQLAKMGKPEVETLDRLGNKYNPQYMDEKALTNQINTETNYTANALSNASNGSLGSLSNNILGMQLNKTKALSDAYSKIADVNRNENKTGQQFNLGVDQFNVGQSNQEKDINAANRAAYRREKSKLLGNIGEDLGNIGKEQVYKKLAGKAFGYSYDGEYLLKPDGTKVSEKELDSTIKTNLSSVGATEKDGKYFDTTGKEISKEEVLKMIGTQKTFNKNYQGKFSSMNTNFGNISLTNNNKQ